MTPTNIRHIITHADCADGIASALILRDAFPSAEIHFVQYGTEAHRAFPAAEGQIWCDITPVAERAQEFVDAGAWVLDHHVSARPIVERFGERGCYSDEPGVSGATLAFRHVWSPRTTRNLMVVEDVCTFAGLAGIRDTWQRSDPTWEMACEQAAVLQFLPWNRFPMDLAEAIADGPWWLGKVLRDRHREHVRRAIEGAYRFEMDGKRVVIFEGVGTTVSDAAEELGDQADLVVGFAMRVEPPATEPKMIFSLRSHTGVDVSGIAKANGGGGHRAAAGFSVQTGETYKDRDPYGALVLAIAQTMSAGGAR